MIRGEGCFVHRMMPPIDWDYGPIPQECYDKKLTKGEIENILYKVYLEQDRVKKLAASEDPIELSCALMALKTLAEIDADFIWCFNLIKD